MEPENHLSSPADIGGIDSATQTYLARFDPQGRLLHLCGYALEDLAQHASFEETCYLLWNQRLPSTLELEGHAREMADDRALPTPVLDLLWTFPREIPPLVAVRSAVSTLGAFDPDAEGDTPEDNARKALRITAQLPTIVAAWNRIRADEEPVNSDAELGQAANLLAMLNGEPPDPAIARLFERILILYAEQGLDASTFSARITASTLSDMHSCVTSALGTVKGSLHGMVAQAVMEALLRIGSRSGIDAWTQKTLRRSDTLVGFEPRGQDGGDPRATLMRGVARDLAESTGDRIWFEMAEDLEEAVAGRRPDLKPSLDFYAAPALYVLGISPDLTNAVLTTARVAGWTAHVLEQRAENRILRLRAEYVGDAPRPWVPLDDR